MSEKMDRRVRKTRAQMRAGLAYLMKTKSIKEITVKDLVEAADINRSTFYLHYTDIYTMLPTRTAPIRLFPGCLPFWMKTEISAPLFWGQTET